MKLSLPFMSLVDIRALKAAGMLSKDDFKYYLIERFNLEGDDIGIVNRDELSTAFPALKARLFDQNALSDRILSSEFITDARLKTRMYLAVKRSDNRLMDYYNQNYPFISGGGKFYVSDIQQFLSIPMPFWLDDRRFFFDGCHVKVTKRGVEGVVVCTIHCDTGQVSLVEGDEHKDLRFILSNVEYLLLYNEYPPHTTPPRRNEHRRPKIRRRLAPR